MVIMQLMTMIVSREVGTDDETTDYLMMMVSTVGWVVAAMVSGQGPLPDLPSPINQLPSTVVEYSVNQLPTPPAGLEGSKT